MTDPISPRFVIGELLYRVMDGRAFHCESLPHEVEGEPENMRLARQCLTGQLSGGRRYQVLVSCHSEVYFLFNEWVQKNGFVVEGKAKEAKMPWFLHAWDNLCEKRPKAAVGITVSLLFGALTLYIYLHNMHPPGLR